MNALRGIDVLAPEERPSFTHLLVRRAIYDNAGLVTGGDDGIELLREATAVLQDSPAALARARASTELGAALRRFNRRADARASLALGLELAERCGATALVERAHEELIATGARPRRAARTGVESLTATELRVARMVRR